MSECDTANQSFVIRIWLEDPIMAGRSARWRGHMTYVSPTGPRRPVYFSNLRDLELMIGAHLTQVGVRFGWGWRVRAWRHRSRLRREVEA